MPSPASSSLDDPRVRAVLDRLHGAAGRQAFGLVGLLGGMVRDVVTGHRVSPEEESDRLRELYVPLGRKQGGFAYQLARSVGAHRVVEFGTSFGVSTTYLAAAVRDNGGGLVIGSELQPAKVRQARANLEEAGLGELVDIREGDARETLADPGGTVDLLLLDGFKDLYLPILEMLTPHLRPGSVVLADNIFTFYRALRPYVAFVRDAAHGFRSTTLFLGDGMECSVRL